MTVKGQRQLLFGLIKGKPRQMREGDAITLNMYGVGFFGQGFFYKDLAVIESPDEVSFRQGFGDGHFYHEYPSARRVNGEVKHTISTEEINQANIKALPFGILGLPFGFRDHITWEPTPEEFDFSAGRRK